MNDQFSKLGVDELRILTRAAGWSGSDMSDMRKVELLEFLTTGKRPKIRYELEGGNLILSRRPATIDELVELVEKLTQGLPNKTTNVISGKTVPSKSNKREKLTRGRPKSELPTDTTLFVAAIVEAYSQGRPFRKTGDQGLYVRRGELPAPFNIMGKHQMEILVTGMLKAGQLKTANRCLIA
jgi:hypothetical protein